MDSQLSDDGQPFRSPGNGRVADDPRSDIWHCEYCLDFSPTIARYFLRFGSRCATRVYSGTAAIARSGARDLSTSAATMMQISAATDSTSNIVVAPQ